MSLLVGSQDVIVSLCHWCHCLFHPPSYSFYLVPAIIKPAKAGESFSHLEFLLLLLLHLGVGGGFAEEAGAQAPVVARTRDEGQRPGAPKDCTTVPSAWNHNLLPGEQALLFGFLDPTPTWSWGSSHTKKQFLDTSRVSENSTQL